jgi:hypothetical protein
VPDRREVEKSTMRPHARYRVNKLLKLISSEVGTTQVICERRTGPKQRLHQVGRVIAGQNDFSSMLDYRVTQGLWRGIV